jgi:uncharacterized protein YjdB
MKPIVRTLISLSASSATVVLSGTLQLTATAVGFDEDGNSTSLSAKWQSSNPAVATVSQSGLVTTYAGAQQQAPYFVGGGKAIISATALLPNGAPINAPALCEVTVLSTKTRPYCYATQMWDGVGLGEITLDAQGNIIYPIPRVIANPANWI